MATIKVGARLKSNVCDTEVMVISCADPAITITCGGTDMLDATEEKNGGEIKPEYAEGSLLGKRYVDTAGSLELLCVKAGSGSLAANGEKLVLKEAKPLPSSD